MTSDKGREKTATAEGIAQVDARTKIIYDGSNMRSVYANVANVASGREEIAFQFGITRVRHSAQIGVTAQLIDRVTLSPFAAKRLAILLDNAIRDYESQYGPLEVESPPSTGPDLSPSLLPRFSKTERTDEKAGLLFQLTKNLNVEVGIERSFKLLKKTILANRFLLGFKQSMITENPGEKILDICERMNMPQDYLEAFQENLSEANIVLFGFEENEMNSLYKAYLEFGDRFEKVIKDNPNQPEPFLIHLGFKWDASDNTRCAMAKYTCFPSFSVENMLERLSNVFYSKKYRGPFEIAEGILNLASSRIGHDKFLYLEVDEENNPRKSFDINMYRANLRLKELHPILSKMCLHYSISSEEFHLLYEPVKTQIFGHLSGGIDREGRDFLTVYFGVKGSSR